VHSYPVVNLARRVARARSLPLQLDLSGSVEGNDSMAAVLAAVDAASLSLSFPIRNMHTSSELGCDSDVLAAIDIFGAFTDTLATEEWTRERLKSEHIDLKRAERDLTIPASSQSEREAQ
jgi:endoglucanase